MWNVVAAPEFSVSPHHWCFPVAGCVAYRGYFHEQAAREFAAAAGRQGYDVVVEGVPAYSTLGHFDDPVLNTMLRYGNDELAATFFHELAHQLLYVKDDSAFNEAFATTVEEEGLARWLAHVGPPGRIETFRRTQARAAAFVSCWPRRARNWRALRLETAARGDARAQAGALRGPGAEIRAPEKQRGRQRPL